MSDQPLTPIEQQTVPFYKDTIQAVRMSDGTIYIAVRPVCDNIGINWASQYRNLKNDPILAQKIMSVVFKTTDIDPDSKRPRTSTMIALPLQFLHGWLFRIDSRRVKESVRDDLIRYQERCYAILAEAFSPAQSPTGRRIQLYRKAGRSEEWIRNRLQGINTRVELEGEWKARGIENTADRNEYAILTAEISQGTFGLTPAEHRELKELEQRHDLRDHMSNLELALIAVGEATTTELAREQDAQGFEENLGAAREGGRVAGETRERIEDMLGRSVVTPDNFLPSDTQPQLLDAADKRAD